MEPSSTSTSVVNSHPPPGEEGITDCIQTDYFL